MERTDNTVKRCINCGRDLPEGASFCPYCETSQLEVRTATAPKLHCRWSLFALMAVCCVLIAAAVILPRALDQTVDDLQPPVEAASAAEPVEITPEEPGPTETDPAVTMAALRKVEEPEDKVTSDEPEAESVEPEVGLAVIEPEETPELLDPEETPAEIEPEVKPVEATSAGPEPELEPLVPEPEPVESEPETPEPEPVVTPESEPADEPAVTDPEPVEASQPQPAESSAQLLWTDAHVSNGQVYVNYNRKLEKTRFMAKGQKFVTAFLYDGELVDDGTLTASGDVGLDRIDRGVYRMSMNGWNGGTITYSSGGAVSTMNIAAQLPEFGAYASAEASMSGFISSFTVSENSTVFYLAFRDGKALTLRSVTGIRVNPEIYSSSFTVEPVTEGQVYKVTVDPAFNQSTNASTIISFFCRIDDIYGSRDVLSNVSISNSVTKPYWQP